MKVKKKLLKNVQNIQKNVVFLLKFLVKKRISWALLILSQRCFFSNKIKEIHFKQLIWLKKGKKNNGYLEYIWLLINLFFFVLFYIFFWHQNLKRYEIRIKQFQIVLRLLF